VSQLITRINIIMLIRLLFAYWRKLREDRPARNGDYRQRPSGVSYFLTELRHHALELRIYNSPLGLGKCLITSPSILSTMSERSRLSTSSTTTIITTESLTTKEKITTHSEGSSIEIWVRTNHYFLVSKPVLTEVPWFEKFFSEQQDQAKYYLPDNNGLSTLRMLFSILHHKLDLGDSIPVSVSELFRIAAVCNKYNVADIVMPHVEAGKWIEPYWEDQKPRDRDWVGWVKILGEIYRTEKCCPKLVIVLDVISANMHLEGGRWIFECGKKKHHVAEMDYWDTAGVDSECKQNS
jgi:hypothetical protein